MIDSMLSAEKMKCSPFWNRSQPRRALGTLRPMFKGIFMLAVFILMPRLGWAAYGFGEPENINSRGQVARGPEFFPNAATDGQGTWISTWYSYQDLENNGTEGDIFYSRSVDDGKTWSEAHVLSPDQQHDTRHDLGPRIIHDKELHWLITWFSYEDVESGHGIDDEIMFSQSTDGGQTWIRSGILNTDAEHDSVVDSRPCTTSSQRDYALVAWQRGDKDSDVFKIYTSRKVGSGEWEAPAALHTLTFDSTRTEWIPELATDGVGNWICVFASKEAVSVPTGTEYEVKFSRSTDEGVTWSSPRFIYENGVAPNGDDGLVPIGFGQYGPRLFYKNNTWMCCWGSTKPIPEAPNKGTHIRVSRSIDFGETWSIPTILKTAQEKDLTDDVRRHEFDPHLGSDGESWIVVWATQYFSKGGSRDTDVVVSRSFDNGQNWSLGVPVNNNAFFDQIGSDEKPQLLYGGNQWLCLWQSNQPEFTNYEDNGGSRFRGLRARSMKLDLPEVDPDEIIRFILGHTFFDMNADGSVDMADYIVRQLKQTESGNN